jgi:hypothetical protein
MKTLLRCAAVASMLLPIAPIAGCASNSGGSGSPQSQSGDGSGQSASGSSSGEGSGQSASGSDQGSGASASTGTNAGTGASSGSTGSSDAGAGSISTDGQAAEDYAPKASDFDCLQSSDWTTVGVSRFKNVLGHTAEMLAVARSADGGVFPVGTFIQLIPAEASVKRGAGYSAVSHDWEFFSLNASATGTTINAAAGDASVINFTGMSCLGCHSAAAPQWDLECGDVNGGNTHGCAALPLTGSQLAGLQQSDPRCP